MPGRAGGDDGFGQLLAGGNTQLALLQPGAAAGDALAIVPLLEEGPGGFFLVIEGSQVDWANHANDADAV